MGPLRNQIGRKRLSSIIMTNPPLSRGGMGGTLRPCPERRFLGDDAAASCLLGVAGLCFYDNGNPSLPLHRFLRSAKAGQDGTTFPSSPRADSCLRLLWPGSLSAAAARRWREDGSALHAGRGPGDPCGPPPASKWHSARTRNLGLRGGDLPAHSAATTPVPSPPPRAGPGAEA